MLSYRKSQQVLLAEKLKKKNVIHAFGVSGSGITMARLCHSAFVRVATRTLYPEGFITTLCHSAFVRVATRCCRCSIVYWLLCHSAFVRVATVAVKPAKAQPQDFATAHSCGLRRFIEAVGKHINPLPQRIRAGCDCGKAMQRTANLLREGR